MRWLSQLWTQIWITLVVAAVSLALYASLGRQLIPLVETLRPDIEQQISAALGQPVHIGDLQGDWHILAPVVRLQNIILGEQQSGLRIGQVEAELDVSASAFYQLPVFKRIEISDVRGHIKELPDNRFVLAEGWQIDLSPLDPENSDDNPSDTPDEPQDSSERPLWLTLLELQQSIIFRDWRITSESDEYDDQLEISQLEWRNRADSHALEGTVAWGLSELAEIQVKGRIQGQLWPWKDQSGELYLSVDNQDWMRWVPNNLAEDYQLQEFTAGIQGWATLQDGGLSSLYANLSVPSLRLNTPQQPLVLSNGSISMRAQRSEDDWHMRIVPEFEQALPLQQMTVSAINLDDHKGWQLGVPRINLASTANMITDHALLPEQYLKYVTNLNLAGHANNLRVSLIPPTDTRKLQLNISTDIEEASSDSYIGIPAFSNLSGQLSLNPYAGKLTLNDDAFGIYLKDVYDEQWQLTQTSGAFYWQIQPDQYRLQVSDLKAELKGVSLSANVGLRIPASDSDIEANTSILVSFKSAPSSMKQDLVPDLLDESIRNWINDSILGGNFNNGVFVLNGRLGEDRPESSNSIQLYLDVADGELKYLQDWPAVTDLNARLMMNAPDLDVWVDSGKTLGGQFVPRSARIKLRPEGDTTHLHVAGRLTGEAQQGLRYFTETPLQQVVQGAFDQWQAKGGLDVSMVLEMPLGEEGSEPDINLDAHFSNTDLYLGELKLQLEQLNGTLNFNSQHGITANQISGSVFGGEFQAGIESDPYPGGFNMMLLADGGAQWQPFKQWLPLFLLDPLSGELNYKAALSMKSKQHGGVEFNLNTDLIGSAIDLPNPVGKTAEQRRPLSLKIVPGNETRINMNYDGLLKAALALDEDGLDRGQVYLGGTDPFLPSDKGVVVRGNIDSELKADEWWAAWQHLRSVIASQDAADNAENAASEGAEAATSNTDQSPASHNPLRKIELQVASVDSWGVPMGPVTIDANQQWNEWRFNLTSDLTKGLITLKADDQPIDMQLDYIHMPVSDDDSSESDSESDPEQPDPLQALDPRDFPAMDMQLKEFYLGSRNLGSWQVSSRPAADGMHITLHESNMKGMNIDGDVYWRKQGELHTTHLDTLQVRSKNIGKVLRAFRQKDIIDANKMKSAVKLNWQGSPLKFNLETLNGLTSLRLEKGTLNAEGTDALKAFGALNFNSISRRLQLDFSDLYQSGLAFDVMKAKARIDNGVLTLTEPLLVDGPGGKFLMSGNTNLMTHEMDMKLAVTFPVTGTLPMVAVLAGLAPPVAAAIYVSEKLVGDELERFTSASYTVKGSWEEPDLKIDQAFNNEVEGKETRSFKDRILSIFGLDDD